MHILFVADGRSPITCTWIRSLLEAGVQVSLISTYPCQPLDGVNLAGVLPVAFAGAAGSQAGKTSPSGSRKGLVSRIRPLAQQLRHLLGPWTLPFYESRYLEILHQLHPDIVHAMRIPFEGMLASATPAPIPLVVSTWGNDFTLHASASPRMSALTRRALRRADALMSDTHRDVVLARQWGYAADKPALVVPGNGGLDLAAMQQIVAGIAPLDPPQIINPRGLRSYARSDTFFQAIPLVLARCPQVKFVCPMMEGQKEALDWVDKLHIEDNVRLLPFLTQQELWQEVARSLISVSITRYDGTPNSLLEAMALGCFPVCGEVDSLHDWITTGSNGLLVDSADPQALADALIRALEDNQLRQSAARINQTIIAERAEQSSVRQKVLSFYQQMIKK